MGRFSARACRTSLACLLACVLALLGACGGGSKSQSPADGGLGGSGGGTADGGGSGGSAGADAPPADAGPPFVAPAPVVATIGPAGGVVRLPGFVEVTFPAGAFAADQAVTVEATAREPVAGAIYDETTLIYNLAARANYDVDIATGAAAPTGDVSVRFTVPDALAPADQVDVYGDFLVASDSDHYEVFNPIPSTARDATSVTVSLPGQRFVALRRPDGQNAAVLVLGQASVATAAYAAPGDNPGETAAASTCPTGMIGPPLASLTVTSPFDPNRMVTVDGVLYIGHFGTDFRAADGDPLYAVGDGTVLRSYVSDSFGESILLFIPKVGTVRYAHMKKGSRKVNDGDRVCAGQQIGAADNTGLTQATHLHFELAPVGAHPSPVDPFPCIDASRTVPQMCGKWQGTIHAVETHNETSSMGDNLSTTTNNWMERTEHTWTMSTVHEMGTSLETYDAVDLEWVATYTDSDSTVTTYTTGSCPGTTDDTVGSGNGGGMSRMSIMGDPAGYAVGYMGSILSFKVPLTTTDVGCDGTTSNMQMRGVQELITAFQAEGLMQLMPSPADPNTFVGRATIMHLETPQEGGMVLFDQTVDWNFKKTK